MERVKALLEQQIKQTSTVPLVSLAMNQTLLVQQSPHSTENHLNLMQTRDMETPVTTQQAPILICLKIKVSMMEIVTPRSMD